MSRFICGDLAVSPLVRETSRNVWELSNLTWVKGQPWERERWSSDSGLTNQKARLDHVRSAKHMLGQSVSEHGRYRTCSCEAERSAWEGLQPRPRASGVASSHSRQAEGQVKVY